MANEWSKKVFAKNLTRYMELSGKNQKELAEIAGVSAPTFNEWVKGKKFPRIDKIQKMADYFGVLKSDLIEDKDRDQTAEEKETPTGDGGLPENVRMLVEFAKSVPEDKAEMILRVIRSIVEAD